MSASVPASAAFGQQGEEGPEAPSRERPVDLVHLARQTLGDHALEEEVLALFVTQLENARQRLGGASPQERRIIAHGLKGAARGVGAFAVADCAGTIEREPEDETGLSALYRRIDEVRDFVAAISR